MPVWLPITITAALFQCWRTAAQQKLRSVLSVNGAGFVRYLYGTPCALGLLLIALIVTRLPLPVANVRFVLFCIGAGVFQILATVLLIMSFGHRNFAVGTAYSKTDVVQSAVVAWFVLHEVLSPLTWTGIALGLCGVATLSLAGRGLRPVELLKASVQPAALCGLGAGLCFAFTTVLIKLSVQAVSGPSVLLRALFALVVTNTLQVLMQGCWLAWREPRELRKTFTTWRSSARVGTLSAAGSACWFAAFGLGDVAVVRAVGQVEIVFTLLFSRFYLQETLPRRDVAGLVLVVGGVLLIILGS